MYYLYSEAKAKTLISCAVTDAAYLFSHMQKSGFLMMWLIFHQGHCFVSQIKYKMSSFKSSENIQKKVGGPDRSVSDNQSSSVTLNELAVKAR